MNTAVKELLEFLSIFDPLPQGLIDELNKDPEATLSTWLKRSRAEWNQVGGAMYGISVYNYLHPPAPAPPSSFHGVPHLILGDSLSVWMNRACCISLRNR